MAIRIVPLRDEWAIRAMQICVRSVNTLPVFARDLIDLLVEDARAKGSDVNARETMSRPALP
jgi:hypothetical protein